MDISLGPYRFNYPDDGLAIYKLEDLVEQYFLCNEHFWFQVLCVGGKMFKFRVSTHTEEEQGMKIWKTFRGVPREKRSLSDYIDVQKGTAGQFHLIWMSVVELSLALRILEDRIRGLGDDEENKSFKKECQKLKEAMIVARKWKQKEEMQGQCCW
ncbi:uncharacterized protein EURHEDRAFT_375518 [Aspergillus ruber CBS 135680]|uniref:Uncharacterized protein n=1 Tax=Aspergillus ruber (strain CBS 135680) TaxID=1388766 RepID=A0A017SM39_ASPRC|nr:uncharacterized protein EURHEDRAFT_375518 [Aspergillus ruber CBS 135680]EYE97694.1 hypothetical protein EURHEDRAFT_375518 [Aspergillus ruber CBS 135680]